MEATDLAHGDLVSATAWNFSHLCSHHAYPETTIFSYFPTKGAIPKSVTRTHIASLLRPHAVKIGFQRMGFYLHEIGSHSLCSGDAMTFNQAHISDSTIKIIVW